MFKKPETNGRLHVGARSLHVRSWRGGLSPAPRAARSAGQGFLLSDLTASPSSELRALAREVSSNTINNMLFLPSCPEIGDIVFDLSSVGSFSSRFVANGLGAGSLRRYASLSQLGYYMFLAKLTVHFFRPENEVNRPVLGPVPFRDRLRAAIQVLRG